MLANESYVRFEDVEKWGGVSVEIDVVYQCLLGLLGAMFCICAHKVETEKAVKGDKGEALHEVSKEINIWKDLLAEMGEYLSRSTSFL